MTSPVSGRGGPQPIPRPDDWSVGAGPMWRGGQVEMARIVEAVASYTPSEVVRGPLVQRPDRPGRESAVLVALYDDSDRGPTTILTRRPRHMRKHAGEVAFPGGGVEDADVDRWDTARREAHEEVDLDPTLPRRIGELDRFVTGASWSLVTPIVAILDEPPTLIASPDEVEEILRVPLAELRQPDVYRQEIWRRGDDVVPMHFFDLVGDTIWGATALMIHGLLTIVG